MGFASTIFYLTGTIFFIIVIVAAIIALVKLNKTSTMIKDVVNNGVLTRLLSGIGRN